MPSITISRGTKSGGIALANKLAQRLGYRPLSREILVEGAKRYGIDEATLLAQLTQPPGFWERLLKERRRYLVFMKCSLLQAVQAQSIIYHGNAGQVLLEGIRSVLRVRIDAPLIRRIEAEMEASGVDREEAKARIVDRDDRQRRWVKYLYNREWDDASLYDLSINLATMSLETACDIICHAVGEPEFQSTEDCQRLLEDACLQCEVEATLAQDDVLWKQGFRVQAASGEITILGQVETRSQKAKLESLVANVPGVQSQSVNVDVLSEPLIHRP
jgi:cytidylate kinase